MTQFLRDILRQPDELQRVIQFLCGSGRPMLDNAAAAVRKARHVYVTGIGSSWHAALNAGALFHLWGHPVYIQDAAELLHFGTIPEKSVIIIISRTGRSVEVVDLLPKARRSGATVIGLTNTEGPLAQESQIPIVVPVEFDHGISVNTYSTLAAAAGALASAVVSSFDTALAASLLHAVAHAAQLLVGWQKQVVETPWLIPGSVYYFLARGTSLGSSYEARLLWEEGVKAPATAMGTGGFRHGPQEIVVKNMRFGMWIDGRHMRDQDLAVAKDLKRLGASVMLIGHGLPADAADLVFSLPEIPPAWQFLIDVIPVQLAAERLARISKVDCDSFRICPYIVEDDYGL
jgi:glucosamine--fructose-6-phosphate aminotransferase (isomerizing)